MVCKKCGTELPEGSAFCLNCGSKMLEEKESGREHLHKPSKKPKAIAAVLSGVLVVALIVIGIFAFSNKNLRTFQKYIENKSYRSAQDQYEILNPEEQTKANQWMREYVSQIEEKYYAGVVDYTTTASLLEDLLQFECSFSEAMAASENIYWDNLSATAFQKAKDLAAENKWREAYEALEEVRTDYRNYDEAVSLQEDCFANYQSQILDEVSELIYNGDISQLDNEAIEPLYLSLEYLSQKNSTFMDAFQKLLCEYEKSVIDNAMNLAEKKEYASALEMVVGDIVDRNDEIFEIAMELSGDPEGFMEPIMEILDDFVEKEIAVAQHLAETGDYDGALEILNELERISNNPDILLSGTSISVEALIAQGNMDEAVRTIYNLPVANPLRNELYAQYVTPWITDTLLRAEEFAQNRKFQEAIDYLTNAQQYMDDIPEFQFAITEYSNYLPRKLSDCHVIEKDDIAVGIDAEDCFGRAHTNVISMDLDYGEDNSYAIFLLDGYYSNLSGIFTGSSNQPKDSTVSCTIYGDGVLLYESSQLERTSNPSDINLDISGVAQLRVEFNYHGWSTSSPCTILDVTVS